MRHLDQGYTPSAPATPAARLARYLGPDLASALLSGRPRDHDLFLAASHLAG
ncbi:MAG: hypothetical protein HGA45_35405, partial [Chloroflexales bacterium]|nr:hypothetical protein [Chloroflexales bacterium]